jgi:hypothetical protein
MDYAGIITMEPGKRSGKPCIRGLRITAYDVLGYLASGMTHWRNKISVLVSHSLLTASANWKC